MNGAENTDPIPLDFYSMARSLEIWASAHMFTWPVLAQAAILIAIIFAAFVAQRWINSPFDRLIQRTAHNHIINRPLRGSDLSYPHWSQRLSSGLCMPPRNRSHCRAKSFALPQRC